MDHPEDNTEAVIAENPVEFLRSRLVLSLIFIAKLI